MNYTIERKTAAAGVFEALQFTVLARANSNSNYAINGVLVTEKEFVATDSHRMHIAEVEHSIEPGVYEVVKATRSVITLIPKEGNFPKWRDIVPDWRNSFVVRQNCKTYNIKGPNIADFVSFALAQKGILVPYDFLNDSQAHQVYFGDHNKPIKTVDETGKLSTVIMPIDTPDVEYDMHVECIVNLDHAKIA